MLRCRDRLGIIFAACASRSVIRDVSVGLRNCVPRVRFGKSIIHNPPIFIVRKLLSIVILPSLRFRC